MYLHDDADTADICEFGQQTDDKQGAKFNLDSGAALSAFPRSFAPEGLRGNGAKCKMASGQEIQDEGFIRMRGTDESGHLRSLSGRVAGVHKALVAASQCGKNG